MKGVLDPSRRGCAPPDRRRTLDLKEQPIGPVAARGVLARRHRGCADDRGQRSATPWDPVPNNLQRLAAPRRAPSCVVRATFVPRRAQPRRGPHQSARGLSSVTSVALHLGASDGTRADHAGQRNVPNPLGHVGSASSAAPGFSSNRFGRCSTAGGLFDQVATRWGIHKNVTGRRREEESVVACSGVQVTTDSPDLWRRRPCSGVHGLRRSHDSRRRLLPPPSRRRVRSRTCPRKDNGAAHKGWSPELSASIFRGSGRGT